MVRPLWLSWTILLLVATSSLTGGGMLPPPYSPWSVSMNQSTVQLRGVWHKTSRSQCAEQYPDRLDIREGGLYFGQKDPAGSFTQWDAGTWEVAGPEQVKMSTANDAVLSYNFLLAGDVLTFTDPQGCEIQYRRQQ
jgi:hypothetical protein